MGLRALHEVDKVTKEQEKVKPIKTAFFSSPKSVDSGDPALALVGQAAPSRLPSQPLDAWLPCVFMVWCLKLLENLSRCTQKGEASSTDPFITSLRSSLLTFDMVNLTLCSLPSQSS